MFKKLDNDGMIVQSRQGKQLKEFQDEMFRLIRDKLRVLPKRENILDIYEQKIEDLKEAYSEEKLRKVKLNNRLKETEKENWILNNIPSYLPESKKDNLMLALSNLNENLDYDQFIVRGTKLINEFTEGATKAPVSPSQPGSIDSIIQQASRIF
jgi:hypothetical protein